MQHGFAQEFLARAALLLEGVVTSSGVPVGDTTLLEGIARLLLGVGAEQAKMELASGEITGTPEGDAFAAVVTLIEAAQQYLDADRAMYEALDAHSKGMEDRRGFCHGQKDAALHKLSFALAPFVGEAT